MANVDQTGWQAFLADFPQAHILQTPAWGELKSSFGWSPAWIVREGVGAQVLFQALPLGRSVAYIPRGPVISRESSLDGAAWQAFLQDLDQVCREHQAVFLKVEGDGWEEDQTAWPAFRRGAQSIQPPRTIVVSLEGSEDEILSRMKSKTRYNIRLAERKGVIVRQIREIGPFYGLLESTSERAEFGIHTREYYQQAFDIFHPRGECALFIAEYQGQPLASIMVFLRGTRSWYFYGSSSRQYHELMAPYLVQWEAMRWAKTQGCQSYDLWGVPDQDLDVLEDQFTSRSDGLWGVYRFKRGFGGQLLRSPGPWDRVYQPVLYQLYLLRGRLMSGAS